MQRPIVGVMGPGDEASADDVAKAEALGMLLASDGWVVLSGGRKAGVMQAVNHGAKKVAGSLTVGILPSAKDTVAPNVDVAIVTEMHNARNNINVLSSRVVIAFGQAGPGTVSEIALALKAKKTVILIGGDEVARQFFERLGKGRVILVGSAEEAAKEARAFLPAPGPKPPETGPAGTDTASKSPVV